MQMSPDGPNMHSPNNPAQASQSSGGFPWGKLLAGCGCLLVLVLAGGGVAVYVLWSTRSEGVDDSGLVEIGRNMDKASSLPGGSAGDSLDNQKIEQEARRRKKASLEPANIREYVQQPLTRDDIQQHRKFAREWTQHPAYKDWVEQFDKMKHLNGNEGDSVAGKLKAVGQSAKWMRSARRVMKAFDKRVREDGGYKKYYGRMIRIGGVVAASKTVADSHKDLEDPNSDAVAEQILEERPEIAKQYKQNLAEAKRAAAEANKRRDNGDDPGPRGMAAFSGLSMMLQGPGTIALARMPEASFETWKALPVAQRKDLRQSMNKGVAPGPYFGAFAVNPAALLMTSFTAELDDIKPEP